MLKQKLARFFRASSDSLTPQEEAVYKERMGELQCLSEFLRKRNKKLDDGFMAYDDYDGQGSIGGELL